MCFQWSIFVADEIDNLLKIINPQLSTHTWTQILQTYQQTKNSIYIRLYQIGIESIQPNANMNSSTNKQIYSFAYFDKHFAVLALKLLYAQTI